MNSNNFSSLNKMKNTGNFRLDPPKQTNKNIFSDKLKSKIINIIS